MALQPALDPRGWYAPGLDYPFISPNTLALVLNYRRGKFAFTPARLERVVDEGVSAERRDLRLHRKRFYNGGNFLNGSSPRDVAADGVRENPYFAQSFAPSYGDTNAFNHPRALKLLISLQVKL
jgi:hypothetical protein